jgi:MFS family permease
VSYFSDRPFRATAAGHFVVDLINSQRALILATWSGPFGLTNSLIGIISAAYTLLGSTLQPAFGLLADRIGARWVATFGILWMALSFGLAVLVPGRVALLLLVLTAMGSAAFHPAGTSEATDRACIRRRNCRAPGRIGIGCATDIGRTGGYLCWISNPERRTPNGLRT